MFATEVPILEGEDETALKAEFVRLCATYPKHDVYTIGMQVFRRCAEPMRGMQAAELWGRDLEILDRIAQAKLNGGVEPNPIDTTEQVLRKLQAIYDDTAVDFKERIAAHKLHAEISGRIVKAIDKTINDKSVRVPPQVIFQVRPGA